jgi:hypothetical protein
MALIEIMTTITNVNDGSIYFNHKLIGLLSLSLCGIKLFNKPENNTIDDSRRTA